MLLLQLNVPLIILDTHDYKVYNIHSMVLAIALRKPHLILKQYEFYIGSSQVDYKQSFFDTSSFRLIIARSVTKNQYKLMFQKVLK